mgnify:CR=1 FL=1
MRNRALVLGSGFGDGGCHEDLGIGHFNHRCHSLIFQRSNLIQYTFKAEVPAHRVLNLLPSPLTGEGKGEGERNFLFLLRGVKESWQGGKTVKALNPAPLLKEGMKNGCMGK